MKTLINFIGIIFYWNFVVIFIELDKQLKILFIAISKETCIVYCFCISTFLYRTKFVIKFIGVVYI